MFPSLNLASFSDAVSTSEAHTTECGGFPQRVAQNSARHRLLYCRCEHLHGEFMFVLSASTCHYPFSSHRESFLCINSAKMFYCLQNTLLSFTVSGVFKEGELFAHHDFTFSYHPLQK